MGGGAGKAAWELAAEASGEAVIPPFLRGSIGAVDVLQHEMKLPSMGSEAMSLSSKARYYMRIAMQHLQNGAFEDARETFTRAIKVDDVPSPVLFLQRGVCFDRLHKHAAAVQDFSKCITLVVQTITINLGHQAAAAAKAEKRRQEKKNQIQGKGKGKGVEDGDGAVDDSDEDEASQAANRKRRGAWNELRTAGHYNRACAYAHMGDTNAAADDFDAAVKLSPEDTVVLSNRALLYRRQGRFLQANRDLCRIRRIEREHNERVYAEGTRIQAQRILRARRDRSAEEAAVARSEGTRSGTVSAESSRVLSARAEAGGVSPEPSVGSIPEGEAQTKTPLGKMARRISHNSTRQLLRLAARREKNLEKSRAELEKEAREQLAAGLKEWEAQRSIFAPRFDPAGGFQHYFKRRAADAAASQHRRTDPNARPDDNANKGTMVGDQALTLNDFPKRSREALRTKLDERSDADVDALMLVVSQIKIFRKFPRDMHRILAARVIFP